MEETEIKAFHTSIRTRITSSRFKVTKWLKADETKHKSWNTKYEKQNEVKWVIKPSVLYASLSKKGFLATDLNTNPTRGTGRQYREMTITMIGRTRRQKWWLWNISHFGVFTRSYERWTVPVLFCVFLCALSPCKGNSGFVRWTGATSERIRLHKTKRIYI